MYDTQYSALAAYLAADQLSLSRRAARSAELLQAARDRKLERRAQRREQRARRRSREAYTTAV